MVKLKQKIKGLPRKPGVYVFKDKDGGILYIGKAKDLQKRVKSHFQGRGSFFGQNVVAKTKDLDWIETESEKEALVLEQQMIKRYQPRFNIEWQDGKNYFFVGLTQEDFARVFITHQPWLAAQAGQGGQARQGRGHSKPNVDYIGPFVQGRELKKFLQDMRGVLPFRTCRALPKEPCLYYDLGLCLGPCQHPRRRKKYQAMIETFKVLLEIYLGKNRRIEGYDISNISGTLSVGSMVVFEKGRAKKSDYRKFKIKRVKGQNDVAALREVLLRRAKHSEWPKPDLILIDGGKGQLKAARKIDIPTIALAKHRTNRDPVSGTRDRVLPKTPATPPGGGVAGGKLFSLFSKNFVLVDDLPENIRDLLLRVRDEAHRFAITYHKKRRKKYLLELE